MIPPKTDTAVNIALIKARYCDLMCEKKLKKLICGMSEVINANAAAIALRAEMGTF